ncbi:hypothetical protein LJC22_06780 [Desulfosarcina sp. OttesenSCG-928-G10]|nr:hypothetical protein [Desulfosarcina sp. OttesenSCG-928-G10]
MKKQRALNFLLEQVRCSGRKAEPYTPSATGGTTRAHRQYYIAGKDHPALAGTPPEEGNKALL